MMLLSYAQATLLLIGLASTLFSSSCLAFTSVPATSTTTRSTSRRMNNNSRNSKLNLSIDINDIESKAMAASEAWDTYATDFLPTADATLVQESLGNRGDVACFRVGGAATPSRSRFVFTNPELGLTLDTAEQEHCVVLCVTNAKSGQDPWPNLLTNIGIDLDKVGDVLVSEGSIYLAVTPEVAKQCTRLLPKEVVGAGVSVQPLEAGDAMPSVGELQDMDVQRLDKRAQYAQKGK